MIGLAGVSVRDFDLEDSVVVGEEIRSSTSKCLLPFEWYKVIPYSFNVFTF